MQWELTLQKITKMTDMCNMDEGTSHHQELDCQSVVKKSGFEDKTDQNSDENDGSDINVMGVGFCEERQYFLEDEQEVCQILDKEFPTLHSLSREATKDTKHLVKRLRELNNDSASPINDIEALAKSIQYGFIPKDIFRKLYERNEEKNPSMFFLELNRLKRSRHVFLAVDQDRMNVILRPSPIRCWYFVPALASLPPPSVDQPWSDVLEQFTIVFNIKLKSKKLMYWVATLLYDFCTTAFINIYANECRGIVGNLKVRIFANYESKLCKIGLYGKDESSKNHAFIFLEAVKAAIFEHSVLNLYLSFAHVEKRDSLGNVYKQNEAHLKKQCDEAVQKMENDMICKAQTNGQQIGNTQNLMSSIVDI